MRDKPLAVIITLVSGAIAAVCCILRGANLLQMLVSVLVTILVFMIIGLVANSIYVKIHKEVRLAEQEEINRLDRERREAALAAEEAKEEEARKAEQELEDKARARVANLYGNKEAEIKSESDDDDDIWASLRS